MELWWKDIDRENRRTRKPVPVPLCPSKIPRGDPGSNPDLHGERLASNHLSPGMVEFMGTNYIF
jgi:hypothetical protein